MSATGTIKTGTLIKKRRDGQVEARPTAVTYSTKSAAVVSGGVPKGIIPFTATAAPVIADYQDDYANVYGEHPTVKIKTIDGDGNYIERNEQAKFIMDGGLIDSIVWDLPDAESGFIIIS